MSEKIQIEIFKDGRWQTICEVTVNNVSQGIRSQTSLDYSFEYLDQNIDQLQGLGFEAVSVTCPLNFGVYKSSNWQSFLLDMIPSGAARRSWLQRLGLNDGPGADFELLQKGALNPPGNLRVKTARQELDGLKAHPGFTYQDVLDRGIDFIEYAEQMGAIVAGSSGAQGEAPKFLLAENQNGQWHGDGAIKDSDIKTNWLVKFPRGKKQSDYQILKAEAPYYNIAKKLGVKTFKPLKWQNDALFVERFDRQVTAGKKMLRFGMESLISAMGVSEFAAVKKHQDYLAVIANYSTSPNEDIKEYVFRDFLNIIMGNTDNHGRNSAFIKKPDGSIRLSPLYDFAPMVMDDAIIPRATKWQVEVYQVPDFGDIQKTLLNHNIPADESFNFLKRCYEKLKPLKTMMAEEDVDPEVIQKSTKKYQPFIDALKQHLDG